jgi:uncharacterized membrane protein
MSLERPIVPFERLAHVSPLTRLASWLIGILALAIIIPLALAILLVMILLIVLATVVVFIISIVGGFKAAILGPSSARRSASGSAIDDEGRRGVRVRRRDVEGSSDSVADAAPSDPRA